MFKVVNLGRVFNASPFMSAVGGGTPPLPPPSEANPGLAKMPFASIVDEACIVSRKIKETKSGEQRSNLQERLLSILERSGEYEDQVMDALFNYCPETYLERKITYRELSLRRDAGLVGPKKLQINVPTESGKSTPRTPSTTPGSPPRSTSKVEPGPWGGLDTPTTGRPLSTVPTSTPAQQDIPSIVPRYETTPLRSEPSRAPVPTGGPRNDLQEQIRSYETALQDFQDRPATPSIYEQTYTPGEAEAEAQRRHQEWLRSQGRQDVASVQCPPDAQGRPQFWDGIKCRGSVGSIPSLPGGMPGEVTANTATFTSPGTFGNYAGMSGARLGQGKQTDDIQFLKKKLKECYASEGDTDRCAEIAKLLRAAIDKINKKEGVQNPSFMPQVAMQPQAFQQTQYSWNNQVQDIAPMATGPIGRVGRGAGDLMSIALSLAPAAVNPAFLTPSFPGGSVGGYASMSGGKPGYAVKNLGQAPS